MSTVIPRKSILTLCGRELLNAFLAGFDTRFKMNYVLRY